MGSWIRLTGVFFRRKTYFYVFIYLGFVAWLGCFSRLVGFSSIWFGWGLVLVFGVLVDDI